MVLFLNFVIAILSSTFAFYEDKRHGLYNEVLIGCFPYMEYDEMYGATVCSNPPFNLMVIPFQWITIFPLKEAFLKKYNQFLCHILYAPVGLVVTITFTCINIVMLPIVYLKHTWVLASTLMSQDETIDEFKEKVKRMKTILKWIFIGPIVLLCSIPIDSCIFVYNLYTKEDEHCACGATAAVEEIGSIEKKALKILVDCCDLTIK